MMRLQNVWYIIIFTTIVSPITIQSITQETIRTTDTLEELGAIFKCGQAFINSNITINGAMYGKIKRNGQSDTRFGNVIRVDQVFGNDSKGKRNGKPFKTISAALEAAQAGDAVWVFPGTYDESLVIPNGVAVIGLSAGVVKISRNVSNATDLITMGENSRLENVSLSLTSSTHVKLRGIVFPGTTSATAAVRGVNVIIDNSTANNTGSSDIFGIHGNGTGLPTEEFSSIQSTSVAVKSIGGGTKRGILVDTAHNFCVRDSSFLVISSGGIVGSYIGAATTVSGATLTLRNSTAGGTTADISQGNGNLTLVATQLINANASGMGFSTGIYSANIIWADQNTLPMGTSFLRPGTNNAGPTEVFVRVSQPLVINSLSVRTRIAPGGTNIDQFILRKNGIDTVLAVSLTGVQLSNVNEGASVAFSEGDSISLKVIRGATSSTQDVTVVMGLY